jgi:hypothetical protein
VDAVTSGPGREGQIPDRYADHLAVGVAVADPVPTVRAMAALNGDMREDSWLLREQRAA